MFIKNLLKEELENLNKMREMYIKKLNSIPKGAVVKKKINNHYYYYVVYRENGKVKMDYIGKDKNKVKEYKKYVKERKKYKEKLKEVEKEIKFIKRALYGKR